MAESRLGPDRFKYVLSQVEDQVFTGKGKIRHAGGNPLDHQPWRRIADSVGPGFLEGQVLKKAEEAMRGIRTGWTYEEYEKEMLGAIAYAVFALMWRGEDV